MAIACPVAPAKFVNVPILFTHEVGVERFASKVVGDEVYGLAVAPTSKL